MAATEIEILRNLRIPTDSGLALSANLYRRADDTARPTILVALPYLKDGTAGIETGWYLEQFAKAGFNALLIDLCGCGASEGLAREPFHADDAKDSLAAIDWACQQSWCDGRIGFWGASYGGVMALRTAAARPKALKAIVAIEGAADAGTEFVHPNGVLGGISPLGLWPTGDLFMQLLPPLHRDAAGDWKRIWQKRLPAIRPRLFDYLAKPANDPSWAANKVNVDQIDVPALIVAGWRDFFCTPSVSIYQQLTCEKRLIVGPWAHMMPDQAPVEPIDLTSITIDWWKRWLLDDDTAQSDTAPVTAYVEGSGEWHGFQTWPPENSQKTLFGSQTHQLDDRKSSFDPISAPVDLAAGYRDGLWGLPLPSVPFDSQADNQTGINFSGSPLDAPLTIAGVPLVRARVSPRSIGVKWLAAKLSVIDANGGTRLITAGAGLIDEDGNIEVTLTDTCFSVPERCALQLTLSAADFPRHWPQMGAQLLEISDAPSLILPTVSAPAASKVEMPLHSPGINFVPQAKTMMPEWSITEDLVTSTTTLALGQDASTFTADGNAILNLKNKVTASASRLLPDHNRVEGIATACVDYEDAPQIKIEARLHVTSTCAEAFATVFEGENELLEKSWRLDLEPQSEPT